jgi:ankyrin repeat protein
MRNFSTFGVDIDVIIDDGYSPLTWAVSFLQLDCVRLLLALRADATTVDHDHRLVSQIRNEKIQQLLLEHSKKSVKHQLSLDPRQFSLFSNTQEKERQELRFETLNRIRSQLAIRLMRYAQPEIVGICLAMSSLDLPPYVLLWIIDWLPNYDRLSPRHKIRLIESVRSSIRNVKLHRIDLAEMQSAHNSDDDDDDDDDVINYNTSKQRCTMF